MEKQTTYKEVKVRHYPNAIVRVYAPELTESERKQREKTRLQAAIALLKELN